MAVTQEDIRQAIQALALADKPLCVHSSLRSFGWVDGGADAVLDALLAEGCTVLVPTMSWDFQVAPPPHLRPPRNGIDYEAWDREHEGETIAGSGRIYTPQSNELKREWMGAIPAALLLRPGRERGRHPTGSFAAAGPLARELLSDQTAADPFSHFRELADRGGYVVLMGVGLDRMTLLHQAEALAGRNLFMRWANGPDGQPIPVFGGECSSGFPRLEPQLAHLIRTIRVGTSLWKVMPAKETVAAAAAIIRAQPEITHCDNPDCRECNDAILGGPILDGF